MAHTDIHKIKMADLRVRATALDIKPPFGISKEALLEVVEKAEAKAVAALADPGNYSDLPDVLVAAPDDESVAVTTVEPAPAEPAVVVQPAEPPPPPTPVLTATEVAKAINGGDSGGLPTKSGNVAVALPDGTVRLTREPQEITAIIGGHVVEAQLEVVTYITSWSATSRGVESAGMLRLMNEVMLITNGALVTLKAGTEFFPHQYSVRDIKSAGGTLLPIR